MKNEMKQIWEMTISGACPTFKGPELIELFKGTENEAWKRRNQLEKETGRIIYLSLRIPQ